MSCLRESGRMHGPSTAAMVEPLEHAPGRIGLSPAAQSEPAQLEPGPYPHPLLRPSYEALHAQPETSRHLRWWLLANQDVRYLRSEAEHGTEGRKMGMTKAGKQVAAQNCAPDNLHQREHPELPKVALPEREWRKVAQASCKTPGNVVSRTATSPSSDTSHSGTGSGTGRQ
jgi:hypothetical protein